MNCKQGDIARIIRGPARDKFVTCIRLETPFDVDCAHGPIWLIDSAIPHCFRDSRAPAGDKPYCNDSILQPIRDRPGEDETLTWKEVPKQLTKV
jgi:hypothetical protein